MKKILLLDPDYSIHTTRSSRYHKNILPNALLKLGTYYKQQGYDVKLLRLCEQDHPIPFEPDLVCITSLFTYWIDDVKKAVDFVRQYYPSAEIEVGGICASLQPEYTKEYTQCDTVITGNIPEVDECLPDYTLLEEEPDFQILTTSRGCIRNCEFCGVNCIEPERQYVSSIRQKIFKRNLIFYDNNLLSNPHIEDILRELILAKRSRRILHCDSISGFDGRILRKKPYLAKWLKAAGFINPKIAWDNSVKSWPKRKMELDLLVDAGFPKKNISVFVLFNHKLPYAEIEEKGVLLYNYGVLINHCRFRPYNQFHDEYYGKWLYQPPDKYFLHENWTDKQIRQVGANAKRRNSCIRYETLYYSNHMNHKKVPYELAKKVRNMTFEEASKYLDDCWDPSIYYDVPATE